MKVRSPTRIDFGGGSLDIFPMYHLHSPCTTSNLAVDIYTEAHITKSDKVWEFLSQDKSISIRCPDISLCTNNDLDLLIRTTRMFLRDPIHVSTFSMAPPGSGLGASSSLLCSLVKAFSLYYDLEMSENELISRASHIETKHLEKPTGIQDYYPAVYGNVNLIKFDKGDISRENISPSNKFAGELEKSILLCHSGVSHQSGYDNWNTMKNRLEYPVQYRSIWDRLAQISNEIGDAIVAEDVSLLSELVQNEWEIRSKLHPLVFNSEMQFIIKLIEDLIYGYKGLGAGNGGVLILFAEPQEHVEIQNRLEKSNARILDWSIDRNGIQKEI